MLIGKCFFFRLIFLVDDDDSKGDKDDKDEEEEWLPFGGSGRLGVPPRLATITLFLSLLVIVLSIIDS